MSRSAVPMATRFEGSYVAEPNTGCWLWLGYLDRDGYGHISRGGKANIGISAHRAAYELYRGTIPNGLQIDHLCRVRSCVNPDHLEVVSLVENLRRGLNRNTRKTHCPRGHAYTGENLLSPAPRRRICRACRDARNKADWAKRRQIPGIMEANRVRARAWYAIHKQGAE